MKREEEKLVPITGENQLQAGMLLVNKPCSHGHTHRFLLVRKNDADLLAAIFGFGDSWITTPVVCMGAPVDGFRPRKSIAEGRLFRIDTGVTDEESPYVEKPVKSPTRERA